MRTSFAPLLFLLAGSLSLLPFCPARAQVQAGRPRYYDALIWKQYYYRGPWRVTWSLGRTWYLGDLTRGLSGSRGRYSVGAGVSTTVWPNLDVATELQYVRLAGIDRVPDRGYTFASRLFELTLQGRYYIEKYHFDPAIDSRDQGAARARWWRPFVTVGVGGAAYWAKASGGPVVLDADSVPVVSEQKYPGYALIIPVGGGVALRASPLLWVLPELTYRVSFTDNLDDVGTRRAANSRNDGYLQFALRFQYAPPRSKGRRLH